MTFLTLSGRPINRCLNPYRIKWDIKSRSKFQFKVKQLLKPIWSFDIVFEEFPVFGTKLKVDFVNMTKRIAVEVNGPQHDKLNKFFHNNSRMEFLAGIKRDILKYNWLIKNDIRLIEIVESDLVDIPSFYDRIQKIVI